MRASSQYRKFDLNPRQVDTLRTRFAASAQGAHVASIVFQPTGARGQNGMTRGRVRVLVRDNDCNRAALFAGIKDSVRGIFASTDISITHRATSFDNSLRRDNRHFDAQRGYREYANFPMGRGQASGAPVRFDYSF